MKKIKQQIEKLTFKYHWRRIDSCRNKAQTLIESGVEPTDDRLVSLSNDILRHGGEVARLWRTLRPADSYGATEADNRLTV